jgi:hypothetical protein
MDSNKHKIVCLGEVLWDILSSGNLGLLLPLKEERARSIIGKK